MNSGIVFLEVPVDSRKASITELYNNGLCEVRNNWKYLTLKRFSIYISLLRKELSETKSKNDVWEAKGILL